MVLVSDPMASRSSCISVRKEFFCDVFVPTLPGQMVGAHGMGLLYMGIGTMTGGVPTTVVSVCIGVVDGTYDEPIWLDALEYGEYWFCGVVDMTGTLLGVRAALFGACDVLLDAGGALLAAGGALLDA
jgi:hypothetical protein